MTTDLRQGLADLAERVPVGGPPAGLWRQGVRRRRRLRVAAAVATAAAVTGVTVLGTWGLDATRSTSPLPADSEARPAIPARLHVPDPRTPGTEEGPPGPLAVVMGAERHRGFWGSYDNGTVGVSAATGEYRFLDLPGEMTEGDDWVTETEPRLSPDGRAVAYWLRHREDPTWVGGFAVYDTVTGEVRRQEVDSPLGLAPESMSWADDDVLALQYGVVRERGTDSWSSRTEVPLLWQPEHDRLTEVGGRHSLLGSAFPTGSGYAALTSRGVELRDGFDSQPADAVLEVRGRRDAMDGSVSPDAETLVMLGQSSTGLVRRILVGALDGTAGVRMEPLPLGIEVFGLLGWQDARHVVLRGVAPETGGQRVGAYSVDVRTGTHRLLVREAPGNWAPRADYADTLWTSPVLARPAPDDVTDPRLVAGACVLVVLLGVGAWRWRRARG